MFNPLKGLGDLKKMRDEAMKLQRELESVEIVKDKGNVHVVVTAAMKVRTLKVNGQEMFDIKDALNDALEEAKKKASSKIQQMGSLQSLLGK